MEFLIEKQERRLLEKKLKAPPYIGELKDYQRKLPKNRNDGHLLKMVKVVEPVVVSKRSR